MDALGVHEAAGPDLVWSVLTDCNSTRALVSPLQRVCIPFKHRHLDVLQVGLLSNPLPFFSSVYLYLFLMAAVETGFPPTPPAAQ